MTENVDLIVGGHDVVGVLLHVDFPASGRVVCVAVVVRRESLVIWTVVCRCIGVHVHALGVARNDSMEIATT
jgi:hypothetical protein